MLKLELHALAELDFPLDLTGLDRDELSKAMFDDPPDSGLSLDEGLRYQILVDCENEEHQAKLIELFEGQGMSCRPLIL